MDFDETRLYYTHQQLQRNPQGQNSNEAEGNANDADVGEPSADNVNLDAVRRHFKEFLREYYRFQRWMDDLWQNALYEHTNS